MNYLKVVLIAAISLTIYMTCSAMNLDQEIKQSDSQFTSSDGIAEPDQQEKKDERQEWNQHLLLLADAGKYWDNINNIPTSDWKETAFNLALNNIKMNTYDSDYIKKEFLDAINAKIAQEQGKFSQETINLISEFNAAIDAQILSNVDEIKEKNITEPTSSTVEKIKSEDQPIEPSSMYVEDSTSVPITTESDQMTTTPESAESSSYQNDLEKWKNQLEKIKTEGKELQETNVLLNETYQLMVQLLESKIKTSDTIYQELQSALQVRRLRRNLYPLAIDNFYATSTEVYSDNERIRHFIEDQRRIQENQVLNTKKLSDELAQRDAAEKIERQKLMDQQKETEMKIQAAILQSREQERISETKAHEMEEKLKAMKQKLAAVEQTAQQKAKEARELLTQNMQQQIKQLHTTPAPKGILATLTETVSNWWYGQSNVPQSIQISQIKEDELLKKLTEAYNDPRDKQAIKNAWLILKNSLLVKVLDAIWDIHMNKPKEEWISKVKKSLQTLVLTYHVMPLQDAYTIVEDSLKLFTTLKRTHRKEIISDLKKFLNQEQFIIDQHQQKEIAKKELKIKQKKESEEKIIRENQKVKEEQERIKTEEANKLATIESYKREKQQWKQMLADLSQNTKATTQENEVHTQKAIKKSQSLLYLAERIPSKSTNSLSQKLKQKFAIAILEQQKMGENKNNVNIYRNMDIFNQAINGMTD